MDGRRDISLQKPPRTCAAGSSHHQLVGRTSLQFFHRYAPAAHPVALGSFKASGAELVGFIYPVYCPKDALANIFPTQRCSNPHKTVKIAHTMIPIQFSQLAVFSAIFNGANYPSQQDLKHYFFRKNCHVIPQLLRYTLRTDRRLNSGASTHTVYLYNSKFMVVCAAVYSARTKTSF